MRLVGDPFRRKTATTLGAKPETGVHSIAEVVFERLLSEATGCVVAIKTGARTNLAKNR